MRATTAQSRFKLGGEQGAMAPLQAAAPRPAARRKAAPAPIRVKSDQPRLTSGFGALGPSLKASGNGEWKEFYPAEACYI